MAFCTKCGKKIAENAIFCTHCGNKVGASKPKTKSVAIVTIFIAIIISVIGFIIWRNSPYWPWPSNNEIRERMEKVIEACDGKVDSSSCKDAKNLYHAKFQYCVKVKNMNAN